VNEHLAFIGVGRMGGRMSTRLLDAGHSVAVFDPSADAVAPLVARGARAAGSPAEAAAGAAFVLCSLPNPAILREAIAGQDGVLESAGPGAVIVDFSTGDPAVARELAAAAAERGVAFLDAPVSRGVVGAENGTLAVMVGGDQDTLETARPVLDHLASDIVHVGAVGAGQVTKLCNNMLTAIITTALGEVLVTGVKAGVELEPLAEALAAGSAGNYVLSGYLPNTLFTEERTAGFALALMRKDLGLFLKAAGDAGMELPLSDLVYERYVSAQAAGLDEADSTSIAELYERAAALRLRFSPATEEVTT
jgi:3-hydroxyisobutyrate dehydrogenase